ncbi:MAG: universal stress protein [Flavobacteriales bacterium]|jgi:nucleotide-binding universal stress UspA family protein|nr:universal stress protein [Flavobacteriales bacterium]
MSAKRYKILVPTDFTKMSDVAIAHAKTVAAHLDAEIYLLHVVPRREEVDDARRKLDIEVKRSTDPGSAVKLHKLVRVGSIFDDVADAAAEIDASLIIMGTHGMRGMQFITGSRALRLIGSSEVPFIVVQERGIKPTGYDNIVVPLDLQKETRQKLALVAAMASTFKSKVNVVVPREKDEFLSHQLNNHIKFAKQFLGERGIAHEATILEADSRDFVEAMLDHATKVDADLITIMNLSQGNIFGVLGVPYEQEILANEKHIPVMLVNPRETTSGSGWSFQ